MVFIDSIHYLTSNDMEAAKEYLKHNEKFDFREIPAW